MFLWSFCVLNQSVVNQWLDLYGKNCKIKTYFKKIGTEYFYWVIFINNYTHARAYCQVGEWQIIISVYRCCQDAIDWVLRGQYTYAPHITFLWEVSTFFKGKLVINQYDKTPENRFGLLVQMKISYNKFYRNTFPRSSIIDIRWKCYINIKQMKFKSVE